MNVQKSWRSQVWESVWLSPLYTMILGFLTVFPISLMVSVFLLPEDKQFTASGILFFWLAFSFLFGLKISVDFYQRGINFNCRCGEVYFGYTPWVCGYCHQVNTPNCREGRYNHLFQRCGACRSIPLGLWCNACNTVIRLTDLAVDMKRYARVYAPTPADHPEILQLRHQQEIERVRRQYQEEVAREERRTRAKQMSSDLEILADKISTTKQFELEALAMVKKLKDAGTLDDSEERVLHELIKDKVLEEFHVDRRGGRQRPFA